jgi:Ca2+-binding RTX toxin-like protein
MSLDSTTDSRPVRARLLLALAAALCAIAPAASAQASAVAIPRPDQLLVSDQGGEDNKITLRYDAQASRFLISDQAGIVPGLGCISLGTDQVVCLDLGLLIHQINVPLGAGDDVLRFRVDAGGALPPQLDQTIVVGGPGSDVVSGGPGRDTVLGERGRDVLAGGGGDDRLVGGAGRDGLIGFGGDDLIQGGEGADAVFGFSGGDVIHGQAGSDTLLGGRGDDRLLGGPKHDLIDAGKGIDALLGGAGPDLLLAKDQVRDARINCGAGKKERFEADKFDPPPKSCKF